MMSIIKLKNVSKFYQNKNNISTGFTKINLELDMGEFVVITGESGSGKSTLLNVISGLDSYEEGEMYIDGVETSHYTEVDYENYRRKYIGNIFQHFNLVNSYTVYQNVELVLLLNGHKKKDIKNKVLEILDTVGLTKYKNTKASKLSGGQKQRVAIARALAKDTPIIVADEPTGNLDIKSAKSIMKLLKDISKNKLVVIVTHNYDQVEEYATRKISMHDGKIIEDKKLRDYVVEKPELVEYGDLSLGNKFRLGFRNAFNIAPKFILLFLVYFFLTIFVFSEYSSLQKMEFEESLIGYNDYFMETDPKRVILNKKDKTPITDSDIEELKKLDNVDYIIKNDLLLDINVSMNHDQIYINGKAKSINDLDKVDKGSIEENSVVIEGSPESSYYLSAFEDEILDGSFTLYNSYGDTQENVKISGIKYSDNIDDYEYTIYLPETILENLEKSSTDSKSTIEITFNNKIYTNDDYNFYFRIRPLDAVPKGEAYGFEEMNYKCDNFNCTNKNINIKISNIYYEDSKDLKISRIINKDNYKKYTKIDNYDQYSNVIFVNPQDYSELLNKGTFQSSIFLKDIKDTDGIQNELDKMGYDTYFMKNNLANPANEMMGIIRIFRFVIFIIATTALFFISYFIIKIILKSRNIYFSTIRILGATKKVARQLLNIELFVDINVAYFIYILLVVLVKNNVINISYILSLVSYFTIRDYIYIYIILAIMSLLISNRYAHKLFKDSVMSTYREEV